MTTVKEKLEEALVILGNEEEKLLKGLKNNERQQEMLLEILYPSDLKKKQTVVGVDTLEKESTTAKIEDLTSKEPKKPKKVEKLVKKEEKTEEKPKKVKKELKKLQKDEKPKNIKKLQKISKNCRKLAKIPPKLPKSAKIAENTPSTPLKLGSDITKYLINEILDVLRSKSPHWVTIDGLTELYYKKVRGQVSCTDLRRKLLTTMVQIRQEDRKEVKEIEWMARGNGYQYRYVEQVASQRPG